MAELNRQTAEIEESGGGHSINRVQQTPKRNATNNLIQLSSNKVVKNQSLLMIGARGHAPVDDTEHMAPQFESFFNNTGSQAQIPNMMNTQSISKTLTALEHTTKRMLRESLVEAIGDISQNDSPLNLEDEEDDVPVFDEKDQIVHDEILPSNYQNRGITFERGPTVEGHLPDSNIDISNFSLQNANRAAGDEEQKEEWRGSSAFKMATARKQHNNVEVVKLTSQNSSHSVQIAPIADADFEDSHSVASSNSQTSQEKRSGKKQSLKKVKKQNDSLVVSPSSRDIDKIQIKTKQSGAGNATGCFCICFPPAFNKNNQRAKIGSGIKPGDNASQNGIQMEKRSKF